VRRLWASDGRSGSKRPPHEAVVLAELSLRHCKMQTTNRNAAQELPCLDDPNVEAIHFT